jgi:hypothetical protein
MTTYDLQSGLRLALMRLGSSQSSPDGSNLSQIVDLKHSEERLAARLVERLSLKPPIDVEKVCGGLAELRFKSFPIEIDGICLDLKVKGKIPKVWVSKAIPTVRKRFTIAHEIGHIIIPWHSGNIVDDIDAPRSERIEKKYRELEAEANRFAAELLMPSAWVVGLAQRAEHVADLMHSIGQLADVSLPAAFLKAGKLGKADFVGAEIKDGIVVRSLRTPGTRSLAPESGILLDQIVMPAAYEPRIISSPTSAFYWWEIRNSLADPGGDLPHWRSIMDEILASIPAEYRGKVRAKVNAIVGLAIGREPKGGNVDRIFKHGLEASQNRQGKNEWVQAILEHPKFTDYVLARARERAAQRP